MRFGPFFYDKRKAGKDKMFTLTLLLYICTSTSKFRSPKWQLVAKEKKLVALATVLVTISSSGLSLSTGCHAGEFRAEKEVIASWILAGRSLGGKGQQMIFR